MLGGEPMTDKPGVHFLWWYTSWLLELRIRRSNLHPRGSGCPSRSKKIKSIFKLWVKSNEAQAIEALCTASQPCGNKASTGIGQIAASEPIMTNGLNSAVSGSCPAVQSGVPP